MIGAGIVALAQVGRVVLKKHGTAGVPVRAHRIRWRAAPALGRCCAWAQVPAISRSWCCWPWARASTGMSPGMLVGFVLYGTFAAFVHELIVGIGGHAFGLVPGLRGGADLALIGILIGFPPEALVVLAGFSAATEPASPTWATTSRPATSLRGETRARPSRPQAGANR